MILPLTISLFVAVGGEAKESLGAALKGYCDPSLSIEKRAEDFVNSISFEDKLQLFTNEAQDAPSVNVPKYHWWNEALHGVALSWNDSQLMMPLSHPYATSFPQVQTSSMSFNETLFAKLGNAIGVEARAFANLGWSGFTFWAPNVNIFRDPRWGRGQETPGEDPHLNAIYAATYVKNFQFGKEDPNRLRVSSCCKHFVAYSLEDSDGIGRFEFDAVVPEQDLADSYLPAFESCVVKGKASSVMCSYNSLNGVPMCANKKMLTDRLRGEWGFEGYVTSDCGAVEYVMDQHNYTQNIPETLNATFGAGMDLDCGLFATADQLRDPLKKAQIPMSMMDTALKHLVSVQMRIGMFDPKEQQPFAKLGADDISTDAHKTLALEAAQQGITLLKNDGDVLPLKGGKAMTVALIGPHCQSTAEMQGNYAGPAAHIVSPVEGITKYAAQVKYAQGCDNGIVCNNTAKSESIQKAVDLAKNEEVDAVVLFLGLNQHIEREGVDRLNVTMPGKQIELARKVASAVNGKKPVIVIFFSGGSLDIAWAKESDAFPALVWAGYPGQEGGQAVADVLFGKINPSGRLTQTFYRNEYTEQVKMSDMRMRPDGKGYPGRTYRFYTGEPVYEFGHGMSYTTFESNIIHDGREVGLGKLQAALEASHGPALSETVTTVKVNVTNMGDRAGAESILLMMEPPAEAKMAPKRTLIAFDKVYLEASEVRQVEFNITAHNLALADEQGNWKPQTGVWHLRVGDTKQKLNIVSER
eukprot:jgi/Bigna1/92882/estExt_fgenesh1_pm.C_900002